jgi:hypothetical protein
MINKLMFLTGMVWLFTCTHVNAQVVPVAADATIDGTPYWDENFVPGEIFHDNVHSKVPVRYNILQDLIEYKESGRSMVLDPKPTIKKVVARYIRSADVFYYSVGGSELHEVETIKSMIASFPDKQEDLIVYAKKEKVSPRKEKTLVQLVQYYNSL